MLKVCYLLKVQFQFYNDEVIDVYILRNFCNKTVTCEFYETVTIDILPVFINAVVFHHVGLWRMIEIKEQYKIFLGERFIE